MTTTRQMPARFASAIAALTALALLAAGCGSSTTKAKSAATTTTTSANTASDSAYCKTVRNRFVHDLDGTTDTFASDPVALKKYWRYSESFVTTAMGEAPAEIRSDWPIISDLPLHKITPVLEKYDFDVARIQKEGSRAENAVFSAEPTKEQARAQTAVNAYESRWCGTEHPQAADVSFAQTKPNKAFCEAAKAYSDYFDQQVIEKKATIEAVRAYATGDGLQAILDKVEKNAPAEIKADADARVEWTRNQWVAVLEKFGYDVRRLTLEGTAKDRAFLQHSDPAVAGHFARTVAYEEQVCGA